MTRMIRTAAVAAVVAIAAFIGFQLSNIPDNVGASPIPIPSPSGEPSASSAPNQSPAPVEPSAEPSGAALVLQLHGAGEAGPVHLVTILDDGRVISSDPNRVQPPVERRLNASGVQLVLDAMAATGLTDVSATYYPVANPGAELGYGGAGPSLEVGQPGGEAILVAWYLFADAELDLAAPQPEAEVLDALATRLATLEEWLPPDAWIDANATPFVPERYLMAIDHQPRGPGEDSWANAAAVTWPLADGLDDFGEVSDPPIDDVRTGCLSAAEGAAVIKALDAAGATLGGPADLVRTFVLSDEERLFFITVSPVLFSPTSC